MASQLEQQQESLRRLVDQWRSKSNGLISDLSGGDCFALYPLQSPGLIRVHVEPIEHVALSSLIDSDNAAVSKLITVLSFDCIEISRLQKFASTNLYRQLLLFGHRASLQEVLLEGEQQKDFAESLPLFMELHATVKTLREVLGNLVQQLNAVYVMHDKSVRPLNSVKNFMLRPAFESLGEGFSVLLVLDEILKQNGHIRSYLSLFARMLNKAKLEIDTFGISVDDIEFLSQVAGHLEKLLGVGLFHHWLQGEPFWNATLQQDRGNRKLIRACTSCINDGLSEILSRIDTWKEYPFDRRKILHYLALFLFSTYSSGEAPEKKTWKFILEMLQLVPVVYVEGGKRILILDVLKSQCHQSLSSWLPMKEAFRDRDAMLSNYLTHLSDMQSRDVQVMRDSLSCWVASFQSAIHPLSETLSEACLRLHLKQIMQGILLGNRMHILVLSMLDLHALLEIPIKREKLKSLCHMVISLKVLGNTFQMKGLEIIRSLPHIINIIQTDVEQFILPSKAKLQAEALRGSQASMLGILSSLRRGGGDTDTKLPDSLTLVLISLQLLQGDGSFKRQLVLSITLDVLQSIGNLDTDFLRIRKHMLKLATVSDFQSIVEEVTDCSFLYWRKEMMELWFSMVYMDVIRFSWLQNLLDAFSDGLWLLKLGHVGKLTLQSFEKEVENAMENEIIAPLCRDVETDLRLHVHSSQLKGSVHVNPTKTGVRNLSWYLHMRPLKLPFKCVDIRSIVEHYLNSVFYNHTSMSSNDWKMYAEMHQLAEFKYGLSLVDVHLEHAQDFDILEVVQNLRLFVETYSYNMVKQVFIQKVPNDQGKKCLKLINIDHVASSIVVHGLRIVPTASSYVFKYLSRILATFSEYLKDQNVKSHLVQESNFWKDSWKLWMFSWMSKQFGIWDSTVIPLSDEGGKLNADLFVQGEFGKIVGKSSLGDPGLGFLNELVYTLTKIGNALGLMRILLAGSSHHRCNISRFAIRPCGDMSFAEMAQKLGLTEGVFMAGKVLDKLIKCESDGHIETFSFTVNTFSKELQSSKHHDLGEFFLIISPLILHMVHSNVHYKELMSGKEYALRNIVNAYDGFVVGVAFVLKVAKQEKLFDALDWFASAKRTLEEAVASLQERHQGQDQKGGNSIAGFKLENQKGINRYMSYQKEIELTECCFNVARRIMSSN